MKQSEISLNETFTFENLFRSLKKCNRGVNYKRSVQECNVYCIDYITGAIIEILSGGIPSIKSSEHTIIYERGKARIITPINIKDRVIQRNLCDTVLIPAITPHLIYDNGASMPGKGVEFTRIRFNSFIEKAKRMWGADNLYALTFDFKSYFDNIPHSECYHILDKYIADKRIVNLCISLIESYKLDEINQIEDEEIQEKRLKDLWEHKDKGVCLGSQLSQIMAVAVPNSLDHYIKDQLGTKFYIRYMDDGIIISNDKKKLQELLCLIRNKAAQIGLTLHEKKTRIVKLTHGVTFMKIKYKVTKDGKTIKRLVRSSAVRQRRKLKKLKKKVDAGKLTLNDVYMSMQSWNAHAKLAASWHTTKSMFKLYDKLFGGYKLTRLYYKNNPHEKRKRKVTEF